MKRCGAGSACLAVRSLLLYVEQKFDKLVIERRRLGKWNHTPAAAEQFGDSANVGGDDRHADRHSLSDGDRACFLCRWENEHRRLGVFVEQPLRGDSAKDGDDTLEAELMNASQHFVSIALTSHIAAHMQGDAWHPSPYTSDRVDEFKHAFAFKHAACIEHASWHGTPSHGEEWL
jgi:hypothetical protein